MNRINKRKTTDALIDRKYRFTGITIRSNGDKRYYKTKYFRAIWSGFVHFVPFLINGIYLKLSLCSYTISSASRGGSGAYNEGAKKQEGHNLEWKWYTIALFHEAVSLLLKISQKHRSFGGRMDQQYDCTECDSVSIACLLSAGSDLPNGKRLPNARSERAPLHRSLLSLFCTFIFDHVSNVSIKQTIELLYNLLSRETVLTLARKK